MDVKQIDLYTLYEYSYVIISLVCVHCWRFVRRRRRHALSRRRYTLCLSHCKIDIIFGFLMSPFSVGSLPYVCLWMRVCACACVCLCIKYISTHQLASALLMQHRLIPWLRILSISRLFFIVNLFSSSHIV